jgi:hypothetical protein
VIVDNKEQKMVHHIKDNLQNKQEYEEHEDNKVYDYSNQESCYGHSRNVVHNLWDKAKDVHKGRVIWSFEGVHVPWQDDNNNKGTVVGFCERGMNPCFCM